MQETLVRPDGGENWGREGEDDEGESLLGDGI